MINDTFEVVCNKYTKNIRYIKKNFVLFIITYLTFSNETTKYV